MLTCEMAILRAKRNLPRTCPDMSGGRYTQSDSAGGSTGTVHMPIGWTRWDAHWRHLTNTIERVRHVCTSAAAMRPDVQLL